MFIDNIYMYVWDQLAVHVCKHLYINTRNDDDMTHVCWFVYRCSSSTEAISVNTFFIIMYWRYL